MKATVVHDVGGSDGVSDLRYAIASPKEAVVLIRLKCPTKATAVHNAGGSSAPNQLPLASTKLSPKCPMKMTVMHDVGSSDGVSDLRYTRTSPKEAVVLIWLKCPTKATVVHDVGGPGAPNQLPLASTSPKEAVVLIRPKCPMKTTVVHDVGGSDAANQLPLASMSPKEAVANATFRNIALSTTFDPHADKSKLSLDWVLTHGIPVAHSVASGLLTLPCVASGDFFLQMNVLVVSPLPFDLVLGRDWMNYCQESVLQPAFQLSSGIIDLTLPAIGIFPIPS
ncbi:hypothetical protein B0H10DRAFT_2226737 [Mycena sp. CBHHK59/15]|nr:hypothetical protein B0H10DRAFT_2226737 [Mycena sp. CBHHK59/15]